MEIRGRYLKNIVEEVHFSLFSKIEPNTFDESKTDGHWVKSMEEELNHIEKNQTWELVPRPKNKNVICTNLVFIKKLNEEGQVVRNRARLTCAKDMHKLKE